MQNMGLRRRATSLPIKDENLKKQISLYNKMRIG
jgi:hypothetical protein